MRCTRGAGSAAPTGWRGCAALGRAARPPSPRRAASRSAPRTADAGLGDALRSPRGARRAGRRRTGTAGTTGSRLPDAARRSAGRLRRAQSCTDGEQPQRLVSARSGCVATCSLTLLPSGQTAGSGRNRTRSSPPSNVAADHLAAAQHAGQASAPGGGRHGDDQIVAGPRRVDSRPRRPAAAPAQHELRRRRPSTLQQLARDSPRRPGSSPGSGAVQRVGHLAQRVGARPARPAGTAARAPAARRTTPGSPPAAACCARAQPWRHSSSPAGNTRFATTRSTRVAVQRQRGEGAAGLGGDDRLRGEHQPHRGDRRIAEQLPHRRPARR